MRHVACCLIFRLLLTRAADAQSLEATYVVLGAQGAIARAVLTGTTHCPAISIDGAAREMNVRALPDRGPGGPFPVLVCEMSIPAGAGSASIANSPLPLPKPTLTSIIAFGDTGCRLKAKKVSSNGKDVHVDDDGGKFQDCNSPSLWPFAQIAASVAAAKPDLVIIGNVIRRVNPEATAAPWIVVRGNHEICGRAGRGYFRLLAPRPAQAGPPTCIDLIPHYTSREPIIHCARQQRRRRCMPQQCVQGGTLCRAICDDASAAGQLALDPPTGVGLRHASPHNQPNPAAGAGGHDRRLARSNRVGALRPHPRRRGAEFYR